MINCIWVNESLPSQSVFGWRLVLVNCWASIWDLNYWINESTSWLQPDEVWRLLEGSSGILFPDFIVETILRVNRFNGRVASDFFTEVFFILYVFLRSEITYSSWSLTFIFFISFHFFRINRLIAIKRNFIILLNDILENRLLLRFLIIEGHNIPRIKNSSLLFFLIRKKMGTFGNFWELYFQKHYTSLSPKSLFKWIV